MWKILREKGIRIEPIDYRPEDIKLTNEEREGGLADNLLKLSEQTDKPVVAWIGNLHAAKSTGEGLPFLGKRIANSANFANGSKKLSTVMSQLAEIESDTAPPYTIAKQLNQPIGVPTGGNKQSAAIGDIKIFCKEAEAESGTQVTLSDYDHVLFYPPAPDLMVADFYFNRAQSMFNASPPTALRTPLGRILKRERPAPQPLLRKVPEKSE